MNVKQFTLFLIIAAHYIPRIAGYAEGTWEPRVLHLNLVYSISIKTLPFHQGTGGTAW